MDEQADVEALVREIEAGADPEAREHARAVVGAAIAFHREGVSRLVDAIRRLGGDAALLDLASDEATAAVLVLHGLHPVDPETRLRDALEAARPVLGRMNASAEVIREGDTLRVRVREGTPGQGAMVHVDAVVAAAAPDVAVALERSSDGALVPLERLRAKVRARPGGDAAAPEPDRCELCGTPLPDAHDHLAGEARALRCACMPCAMLFESATGAWRRVPRRAEALPTFLLTDETWAALEVPIDLAFFVRPGAGASVVARYPGPAGAAESTLRLDAWSRVAADNPVAATLVPDVEALLIRRRAGRFEVFRAPIDVCYALVGHIRRAWRGLGGGAEAWARIDAFFDDLRRTGGAP